MPTRKFENLSFSLHASTTDMKMFECHFRDGGWESGELVPFRNLSLSPAASILNYGQGIFEGMKAFRSDKGRIVMFRPEENARRFANSCRLSAIPVVEKDLFMTAVNEVVSNNTDFIPDSDGGKYSMYLRPVCIATEPLLGVKAAQNYLFYVFGSPVGPYFDGVGVVKLMVTDRHRAAVNGIGAAKSVSNYVATMLPREEAVKEGYDTPLFLDTVHDRFIEEAGAANVFVLMKDNTLVTPKLGSILPGITRDSLLRLASEKLGLKVEERSVSVEEVCKDSKECFLCGTGTIITSVSNIKWNDVDYDVNKNDYQLAKQLYHLMMGIQLETHEDPYGWIYSVQSALV